ncbi:MAG: hypothetical protein V2I56_11960, partial [Desulfobacteraceae bacterium]|nr:hypothetical protein [Desulfobacteraceae bacterium]
CVWVFWDHVFGAKYYEVYRSDSTDGEKIMICRIDRVCDIYEYRDITTTCPRIYYYWIKAYDVKGYTSCTFGDYDTGYCELK